MYRLIAVLGILAVICLVAGCGGSSGGEATSAVLTKAQFIKQADAICTKATKEREAAVNAWRSEYSGQEEQEAHLKAGLKEVIAPHLQEEAEALKNLSPPQEDEATVARLIAALSTATKDLAKEEPEKALQSGIPGFEHDAAAYGLKVCPRVL